MFQIHREFSNALNSIFVGLFRVHKIAKKSGRVCGREERGCLLWVAVSSYIKSMARRTLISTKETTLERADV